MSRLKKLLLAVMCIGVVGLTAREIISIEKALEQTNSNVLTIAEVVNKITLDKQGK